MSEKRKFKNPEETEKHMMDEIIENFDFKKCEMVMKFLNWRWGLQQTPIDVEMLKESARQRMKDAVAYCKEFKGGHQSPYFVSSGGLKATAWKNNYGHIVSLQLEFVLTDWDHDGDY